jgi:hypothetical protein
MPAGRFASSPGAIMACRDHRLTPPPLGAITARRHHGQAPERTACPNEIGSCQGAHVKGLMSRGISRRALDGFRPGPEYRSLRATGRRLESGGFEMQNRAPRRFLAGANHRTPEAILRTRATRSRRSRTGFRSEKRSSTLRSSLRLSTGIRNEYGTPNPADFGWQRLIRFLGPDAEGKRSRKGKRPRETSTQELSEREREPLPVSFILFVVFAHASSSQR